MTTRKIYRDGLEEEIQGPVKARTTSAGHTVERYTLADGRKRFFVTLQGTHWCAHGDTVAEAITDAFWKDPLRRPSMEALVTSVKKVGQTYKFTLNEFRLLTGACLAGCRAALKGRSESSMTAKEIKELVSAEWGSKLCSILGWNEVTS